MEEKNVKRTGQIVQKGERKFLVRVSLGYDSHKKKRVYHNHTINGTKKAAEKYLNGMLHRRDMGEFIEPSPMSLDEFLDKWLTTEAKQKVRIRTYEGYEFVLRRYVRPVIGGKKLSQLQPLDIQSLYAAMQQEQELSARTIRYAHSVLKSALAKAKHWRLLRDNPADFVKPPKQTRKEMLALTAEETKEFLAKAKNDRWYALFELAVTTGMRPEEYLALKWSDIDFASGSVTVQRALCEHRSLKKKIEKGELKPDENWWYFAEPKTARSRRTIPLGPSTLQNLKQHRAAQRKEQLEAGEKYSKLDLVFATEVGTPLLVRNLLRRHFRPIIKEANKEEAKLPNSLRLYDLRHTCATLLLAAGENPKIVAERLGHASVVLTLDTYSHVLPTMQKAASDKLENLLYG